jgi:hypothetical protein
LRDLEAEGPLGENWEDYISDLEGLLDDVDSVFGGSRPKKNAEKILMKNYQKLEMDIQSQVEAFKENCVDWVASYLDANYDCLEQ